MKRDLIPQDQANWDNLQELQDPYRFRFHSIQDAQAYMTNPIEEMVEKYAIPPFESLGDRIRPNQAYKDAPFETVVLYENDGRSFKRGYIVCVQRDVSVW